MKPHVKIVTNSLSEMLLSHSDHLCSAGEEFFQIMLWVDSVSTYTKVIQHKFIENEPGEVIAA